MTHILTSEVIRNAERHLRRVDPTMRTLVGKHGPCTLAEGGFHPFRTLATSVISQQLSVAAASTIAGRVRKIIKGPLGPKRLLAVDSEALRAAGLSQAKAKCLIELARRVTSRQLDFALLRRLQVDEAVAVLTDVPGIGPWTAEMFLIFGLKRSNVLSVGDAGLRRATRLLYGTDDMHGCAKPWHPYCSVACWYLWRHLDNSATA